jgi:hypothetical protein
MKKTVKRYIRELSGDASAFQKSLSKQYGASMLNPITFDAKIRCNIPAIAVVAAAA